MLHNLYLQYLHMHLDQGLSSGTIFFSRISMRIAFLK